jgi:hypothetical protein
MPSRLRKVVDLPPPQRRLLLEAALVLAAVRLGLLLLAFRTLRRLLARFAQPGDPTRSNPAQVAWAVNLSSRWVPCSTCLVRALAAQLLLARRGYSSRLHIGAAGDLERFRSHAWLECQGQILVGDGDLEDYIGVVTLEPERAA